MDEARFQVDAIIGAKAVAAETGDLLIEGWLARYGTQDRDRETFARGAFQKAIDKFLDGTCPLLYHHDPARQLGQVISLEEREEGVYAKALVAKPTPGSWAEDVYDKVKRGIMRGLSSKGMFTKLKHEDGSATVGDVDLYELSVTPLSVHTDTTITAVAQKAFDGELTAPDAEAAVREYFQLRFDTMEELFAELDSPAD